MGKRASFACCNHNHAPTAVRQAIQSQSRTGRQAMPNHNPGWISKRSVIIQSQPRTGEQARLPNRNHRGWVLLLNVYPIIITQHRGRLSDQNHAQGGRLSNHNRVVGGRLSNYNYALRGRLSNRNHALGGRRTLLSHITRSTTLMSRNLSTVCTLISTPNRPNVSRHLLPGSYYQ